MLSVEKELGVYLLNNQPRKPEKGLFWTLLVVVKRIQRIVVIFSWWRYDVCWKPTGVCKESHQVHKMMFVCYASCYFGLILNLSVEGGSVTNVTRRFDYALGLISQLKVNISYSEVGFSGLRP